MELTNKLPFTDLQLNMDNITAKYNLYPDVVIEVKQYLPIEDKYDLISIALQNSYENGHFNTLKLDMYFHLYIVYMYTNIEFTEAQKDNPMRLYDLLQSHDIISGIISHMKEEEYNYLCQALNEEAEKVTKYNNTIASVINGFIQDLPKNAEAAKDIIDQFDPEAFQSVMSFAKAANGGRSIE